MVGIKLVLLAQTSPFSEMIQSCKCVHLLFLMGEEEKYHSQMS